MIIIDEIKPLGCLWTFYENIGSGMRRIPDDGGIEVLEKSWIIYAGLLLSHSDRIFMTHDGSKPQGQSKGAYLAMTSHYTQPRRNWMGRALAPLQAPAKALWIANH